MLARLVFALAAALLLLPTVHAQAPSSSSPPSVKLSGYIQGRGTYQENVGVVGTINRARLTAAGGVPGNVTWRVQGEFRTGNVGTGRASVSLQDAYIRWTHNTLGVQIGQFKTPFTREFITSLAEVETADRATVVDSLAPKRDIGIMADYAFGGRATISAGIFNGEGQNVTANTDSSALGVARVSYRPIPYLVLGANAARYFADSTRYGVDASVEAPWIILRGEYIGQHRDIADNADDKGWYALAAAPVRPWLQPVFKYEWFNRPGVAPAGTLKNRAWTAGVNLFPWGRTTRLTLEYVSRKVGEPGVRKSLGLAQAQVIF
jgi:Phosphate-selective porin O and P